MFWAVSALWSVSCCRMKSTATRAKSTTCSVTAKVAPRGRPVNDRVMVMVAVLAGVTMTGVMVVGLAAVGAETMVLKPPPPTCCCDAAAEGVGGAGLRMMVVSTPGMSVTVTMATPLTTDGALVAAAALLAAEATYALLAEMSTMGESAAPWRVFWPSNVMSAFSAEQLRLPWLNLARICVPESGMEKLAWACWMRRGMPSPSVTLLRLVVLSPEFLLLRLVVVHPFAPATVQSNPVKPLVQIHEQKKPCSDTTLVPPLAHGSVPWHCASADCACASRLCFRITKNSMGMMMAAAMRMSTMITTTMKPHMGSPLLRRPRLSSVPSVLVSSSRPPSPPMPPPLGNWGVVDPRPPLKARGSGHEPTWSRRLWRKLRRFWWAGGGKAASMSEKPDWCLPSSTVGARCSCQHEWSSVRKQGKKTKMQDRRPLT